MRLSPFRSLVVLLAIAAASARAQDQPEPPAPAEHDAPIVFLGLNETGAEEWLRARDSAVVIRVPRGAYRARPYEGMSTTAEPTKVDVESFFVDKFEVTNAQFARFLSSVDDVSGLVDSRVPGVERTAAGAWRPTPGRERHPVTAATGAGALAFAEWVGGALPDKGQWEKAAGGIAGNIYPWGDELPDATRANFARPRARGTVAVGSYAAGASPYGCLDMAGNAYERVAMPGRRGADGSPLPVMIKGGSWLSPHPLNLRVLDMCVQPMDVSERSVGFRCVMADPEPERLTREDAPRPVLRLAPDLDSAVEEATRRNVPIFLSLLIDTCGQCDRTRAQCYADPRFVAYCNEKLVVVVGHDPGDAMDDPHPPAEGGACPLYPGLTCKQHERAYYAGLGVVGGFRVSPGNFVLHPARATKGAGEKALLAPEFDLPKWGDAVEEYIAVFERARASLRAEDDE